MSEFSTLNEIRQLLLEDQDLGRSLRLTSEFFTAYPAYHADAFDDIRDDYDRMKDFVLRGYRDDQRDTLYRQLLCRTLRMVSDLRLDVMLQRNSTYMSAAQLTRTFNGTEAAVRSQLEGFVQDVAMLSLQPDEGKKATIYQDHYAWLARYFDFILISPQWNDHQFGFYSQLILSPTIDGNDALLLVAAVTLSCVNIFDVEKFHALLHIYLSATDEPLRQRALVGLALCLNNAQDHSAVFPDLTAWVRTLTSDPTRCSELYELQMQVIYCLDADKDAETIRKDIMPNIMKGQNITYDHLGLHEKEDDPMDDILGSGETDRKIEQMEQGIHRMMDMQKKGSDVYFSGFANMKRFAFFYTLCNWFAPFFTDHPALAKIRGKLKDVALARLMPQNMPFCDSDRYSFSLALGQVIDKMPKNLVDMISNGEAQFAIPTDEPVQSAAFIRRMYLQDLYRFYRLYMHKNDFYSPFDYETPTADRFFFVNAVFRGTPLSQFALPLSQFLAKRRRYTLLGRVIQTYASDRMGNDEKRMKALWLEKTGKAEKAVVLYDEIAATNPDDANALRNAGRLHFQLRDYDAALKAYERLCQLSPDNVSYQLGYAVAALPTDQQDKGVAKLFELDFEHPHNADIQRALAWGLLMQQKARKAEEIYDKILSAQPCETADWLNAAYSKWFQGKVSDAVILFKNYIADGKHPIETAFANDAALLDTYHISLPERNILIDLVLNS